MVSRTLQPQLPQYLYALSLSGGADPTLAARHSSDSTRNGEPFGELGIVLQQDAAWGDQKGVDESIFPQRVEVDYVRVYQKPRTNR